MLQGQSCSLHVLRQYNEHLVTSQAAGRVLYRHTVMKSITLKWWTGEIYAILKEQSKWLLCHIFYRSWSNYEMNFIFWEQNTFCVCGYILFAPPWMVQWSTLLAASPAFSKSEHFCHPTGYDHWKKDGKTTCSDRKVIFFFNLLPKLFREYYWCIWKTGILQFRKESRADFYLNI